MPARPTALLIALFTAASACGPALAMPLTHAEVADLEPVVEAAIKPAYAGELARTGSTLTPGSPEWNDALHRSAQALLDARPPECPVTTWLTTGCGRHAYAVPSRSMMPTILDHDDVVAVAPVPGAPIHRGDVLAFKVPSYGSERHMYRVIGLPLDSVCLTDGVVELNGQRLKLEPTGLDEVMPETGAVTAYTESLPDGRSYKVFWPTGDRKDAHGANMACTFVPAGRYFMMGDNRAASADSRGGTGMPTSEAIVGIARAIFISRELSRIGAPL